MDCTGLCFGDALVDGCGVCSGGTSGHLAESDRDCAGNCFGPATFDSCDVCSGGNSGHAADSDQDCHGICFGEAVEDVCGVCDGDGIPCDFECHTGDANQDGSINVVDIVRIVNHINETMPLPTPCVADFNNDSAVNVVDIVNMVNAITLALNGG